MKTKKILLVLMLAMFVSQSNAQNVKLAVQAGANFTSMSKKVSSEIEEELFTYYNYRTGLRIGMLAEYELKNGLALQSGLFYTQKGFNKDLKKLEDMANEDSSEKIEVTGDWSNRYNYLELPIHLVYNIKDFNVYVGPYLAYGLGGKAKLDLTFTDESGDKETYKGEADINAVGGDVLQNDFFNEDVFEVVVYKKFDAGVDLGVGYKYDKFLFQAQYSMGFINIIPQISDSTNEFDVDKDYNLKNKGFSLSLSYFFK